MTDIRMKVSVRSARLLDAIEADYPSVAEFARTCGLNVQTVHKLVAMRDLPYTKKGEWTKPALDIATALGKDPHDLWPEHIKSLQVKRSAQMTVSIDDVASIMDHSDASVEQRQLLSKMAATLTPRETKAIAMSFEDCTLDEIGKELNVSRERVRQILWKAQHKMKRIAKVRLGIESMADIQ